MPKYGKPAVASWSPDRLDVFFKSKQGTLIHAWQEGNSKGSHDLGGSLDSDPAAVTRGTGLLDVFARSAEQRMLHWSWKPELGRMSEEPVTLSGFLATNPVPVATLDAVDKLYVFARSVDGGPLRYWESARNILDPHSEDSWSGPLHGPPGLSADPAVVYTRPDQI